jgi:hypothetical protein
MKEEHCIVCGEVIPEGKQVCPSCEKHSVNTAPCKDCEKRHDGCHGHCEDYKAVREWLDGVNALRRKEKEREWAYRSNRRRKK